MIKYDFFNLNLNNNDKININFIPLHNNDSDDNSIKSNKSNVSNKTNESYDTNITTASNYSSDKSTSNNSFNDDHEIDTDNDTNIDTISISDQCDAPLSICNQSDTHLSSCTQSEYVNTYFSSDSEENSGNEFEDIIIHKKINKKIIYMCIILLFHIIIGLNIHYIFMNCNYYF